MATLDEEKSMVANFFMLTGLIDQLMTSTSLTTFGVG